MKKQITSSWIYCFKSGNGYVFLNRWDEVIKRFTTYLEAETFADLNINLIDKKLKYEKE